MFLKLGEERLGVLVEYLASMCKALGSFLSTAREKKKEKIEVCVKFQRRV